MGAIAAAHFYPTITRTSRLVAWAVIIPTIGIWIISFARIAASPKIDLPLLAATTFSFGAVLFLVLSEAMFHGLAKRLTEWRGEKWVKELDYLYLGLGALGVMLSMNRLESVDHKLPIPEFVGPLSWPQQLL